MTRMTQLRSSEWIALQILSSLLLKIIASVRWSMMIKTHTYPEWMCLVDCWHGSLTRLCITNNNMQRWQKADTHSKQREGKCMGAIPPELGNCNNQYLCLKLLCSKAKLSMWKRLEKQLLSWALSYKLFLNQRFNGYQKHTRPKKLMFRESPWYRAYYSS